MPGAVGAAGTGSRGGSDLTGGKGRKRHRIGGSMSLVLATALLMQMPLSSYAINCAAGRYATNFSTCEDCAAGKYSSSSGWDNCNECDPGEYSLAGATGCEVCPAGKYSAGQGNPSCTDCPPGKYQPADRAEDCRICDPGEYSAAGSIRCTQMGYEAPGPDLTVGPLSNSSDSGLSPGRFFKDNIGALIKEDSACAGMCDLDLSDQGITSIAPGAFDFLQLYSLNLKNNQLTYFDLSLLDGSANLFRLNLEGNNLTTLSTMGGFEGFLQMRDINLLGNPWQCKVNIPCFVDTVYAADNYYKLPDCRVTTPRRSSTIIRSERPTSVALKQADGKIGAAQTSRQKRRRGFISGPPSHPILFYNLDDVFEPALEVNVTDARNVPTRRQASDINLPPSVSDIIDTGAVVQQPVTVVSTTIHLSGSAIFKVGAGDYIMTGNTAANAITNMEIMRVTSAVDNGPDVMITVQRGVHQTTAMSITMYDKVFKVQGYANRRIIQECGGCTWVLDENGVLINQGPAGCGSGCWNLDLSNKGITSIPPAAFSGTNLNATLRILKLNDNRMTNLTEGILDGIFYIDPRMMGMMGQTTLDLGGNPWQCKISIPCFVGDIRWDTRSYSRLPFCSTSARRSSEAAHLRVHSAARQPLARGPAVSTPPDAQEDRVPYVPGSMGLAGIATKHRKLRQPTYYSDETGDTVVDLGQLQSQGAAPLVRRQSGQTTIFECGGCRWYTDSNGTLNMEGSSDCGSACFVHGRAWLYFDNKGITSLAPGAFGSTGLRHAYYCIYLNLDGNQLTTLPDDVFSGPGFSHLILSNNKFTHLTTGMLRGISLFSEMVVKFNDNEISSLSPNVFSGISWLSGEGTSGTIDLSNNKISNLQNGTFDGIVGPDTYVALMLNGNQLTTLPADIFRGIKKPVSQLSLDGNQLTTLPDDVFSGLGVSYLILSNNNLTHLTTGMLRGIFGLQSLSFTGNEISTMPSDFFSGIDQTKTVGWLRPSRIRSIQLGNNKISNLPFDFFDGVGSDALELLYLNDNLLTNLTNGILDRFRHLSRLDLQGNPWECKVSIPCYGCPPSWPRGMMKEYGHMNWIGWSGYLIPWDVEAYNLLPTCASASSPSPSPATGGGSAIVPSWAAGINSCERETRSMFEILLSMGKDDWFSGGLGSLVQRPYDTWTCFRSHACLDEAGLAGQGHAVCYKRNAADGSWQLWGLQSEVGVSCARR